jgi:glycosyltransferase involved in cell wall biosynthesis
MARIARIAVVIPVGPEAHHAQWLREAWDSVVGQTRPPETVIVVDDMHGRELRQHVEEWWAASPEIDVVFESPYWRLGVASAFNWGIAIAFNAADGPVIRPVPHDLAVCLGADDRLEERSLEELEATYEGLGERDGYYWFEVQYESGEQQALPCHAAAVTPGLFARTGGYPVEASSGGMDAALIGALMVHEPEALIHIEGKNRARTWHRQHDQQESRRFWQFGSAAGLIRDAIAANYHQTRWGRYYE